jgi:hypothetical protein
MALYFIRGSDQLLRWLRYWYNMGAELGFQEKNTDLNVIFYGGLEHIVENSVTHS